MKRKMIGAATAYIAGLFFASFFIGAIPLLIAALVICVLLKLKKQDYILIAAAFIAAFAVSTLYTNLRYDRIIAYDGKTADISGEVTDIRRYSGEGAGYVIKGKLGGMSNVRISVYGEGLDAEFGDVITVKNAVLSQIEGDYLSSGMNYMRSERVFLTTGYGGELSVEHMHTRKLKNALIHYRDDVISRFRMTLGSDRGDFLAGMIFGEKQGLDEGIRTSLYRCGVGHVLAVSGLHVSILAVALMSLLRLLHANRCVSFGLMDVLLILLIIMANSPVSALRAAIMMNFMYSARLFRRQSDPFNSLAAALLLICLFNPYGVYSSGLILSAAGTFGIAVFAPYITKDMPEKGIHLKLIRSFAAMLCTTICIMPFTMRFFEETSLIAPVSNIIIVPICSVILVLGVIFVLSGGLVSLLGIAGALIDFVLMLSDKMSKVPEFYFSSTGNVAKAALLAGAAVCIVQAAFRKRRYTVIAAAAAFCGVFIMSSVYSLSRYDRFTVAVLGKRDNAAVLVTYRGKTNIIDLSGNYRSPVYVRKYMLENGIEKADAIILTKRSPSQYAAYESSLAAVRTGSYFTAGDAAVTDVSNVTHFEDSCTISGDGYFIDYSRDVLTIVRGSRRTVFAGKGTDYEKQGPDDLIIHYGGGQPSDDASGHDIYKSSPSGRDNFELTFTKDGDYRIRRL